MVKVLFQDKAGNAPFPVAFVSFRESKGVLAQTANELAAKGVQVVSQTSQRIVTACGASYWLA